MKSFLKKYKHSVVLLYFFIYMPWFLALESSTSRKHISIHIKLDNYIPFNEWFVIPYLLWFAYVAITVVYFLFNSKEEFYSYTAFLFVGMTICLIIYTIWPNMQNLRPDLSSLGRDNILIRLISNIYAADTPTNVCPSIHAYNSIGTHIAISKNSKLGSNKLIKFSSFVLCVSICLSTMFIKQHSAFDGLCSIALSIVMYFLVYGLSERKAIKEVPADAVKEKTFANFSSN